MYQIDCNKMTDEQKKILWHFENWLLETKLGYPNDGCAIPITRELDKENTLIYNLISGTLDVIFVVHKNEIPEIFMKNLFGSD